MNYERIYAELIIRAKNRSVLKGHYTEKHHIVPKSMFPEYKKEKWNLVDLFPEEHLVAHLLLMKINPENRDMKLAVKMMTQSNIVGRDKITNKKYSWLKKEMSKAMSMIHKGKIISIEQRKKISDSTKGVSYLEKYGSIEKANYESMRRGQSISKSNYHSNGGLVGVNNPNAKKWILVSPNNEIFNLEELKLTLNKFSKTHKLNVGDLTSVANNKLNHSKLWICFYKDDFTESKMKEKIKIRDKALKSYQYFKLKVTFKDITKTYNNMQELVNEIGSNKDTLTRFIKNPNYIPKFKKYKYLVENKLKIEKVI